MRAGPATPRRFSRIIGIADGSIIAAIIKVHEPKNGTSAAPTYFAVACQFAGATGFTTIRRRFSSISSIDFALARSSIIKSAALPSTPPATP